MWHQVHVWLEQCRNQHCGTSLSNDITALHKHWGTVNIYTNIKHMISPKGNSLICIPCKGQSPCMHCGMCWVAVLWVSLWRFTGGYFILEYILVAINAICFTSFFILQYNYLEHFSCSSVDYMIILRPIRCHFCIVYNKIIISMIYQLWKKNFVMLQRNDAYRAQGNIQSTNAISHTRFQDFKIQDFKIALFAVYL